MSELQEKILAVMIEHPNKPLMTVYSVCARLGERQGSSTNKFYVKVYRNMEKLVTMDKIWVMRGTRDPSVYLAKGLVKGFDKSGIYNLPF